MCICCNSITPMLKIHILFSLTDIIQIQKENNLFGYKQGEFSYILTLGENEHLSSKRIFISDVPEQVISGNN